MRIRSLIWVTLLVLGTAIVFGLVWQTFSRPSSSKPEADDTIPVATEKVRRQDILVHQV